MLRQFGVREVVAGEGVGSADELRALVDEAEGAGVIPRGPEELLHDVFDFVRQEAADVMVPAPDVAWLNAGPTPDAALDQVAQGPYSRDPVGAGSLDRVVGVIDARELVTAARNQQVTTIDQLGQAEPSSRR